MLVVELALFETRVRGSEMRSCQIAPSVPRSLQGACGFGGRREGVRERRVQSGTRWTSSSGKPRSRALRVRAGLFDDVAEAFLPRNKRKGNKKMQKWYGAGDEDIVVDDYGDGFGDDFDDEDDATPTASTGPAVDGITLVAGKPDGADGQSLILSLVLLEQKVRSDTSKTAITESLTVI